MELINNLSKLIKNSPYKRQYIQDYLGISRNTLTNWCTNKSHPDAPQLLKLCELLNVKFEEIYKINEKENQKNEMGN